MKKHDLITVKWYWCKYLNRTIEYSVGWFLEYRNGYLVLLSSKDDPIRISEKLVVEITTIQEAEKCPF